MQKLRFHVLALPHTQVTEEYYSCAYTAKTHGFVRMMTSIGHEVYLYAGEETTSLKNKGLKQLETTTLRVPHLITPYLIGKSSTVMQLKK
jgi:tRNA(Leu) C34 or U34 (ribose-2'-O)-methylase TrmL